MAFEPFSGHFPATAGPNIGIFIILSSVASIWYIICLGFIRFWG